ncbi:MAG: cysteine--tRNA ligase [Pirellulaceae bacterium]|jgi:cysteinyl-tRNA synthetase|nr:cysteine--tRNA ligase [Pirellulaceae bacterium]
MEIRFYNSLTKQRELFESLRLGVVSMYSCGPTVYDLAHIGNFRTFLFGDLLRRFLELVGYRVDHVMNITDVGHMTDGEEDRMTQAASRMKENKKTGRVAEGAVANPDDPYQIAEYYTQAFLSDARKLGYKIAFEYPQRVPKATDHIDGMQEMIGELIKRGHAYVAEDGVVYYSVESFPEYGRLSGNTLENLQSGAGGRVSDENQSRKRHPADFMLWKPDQHHIMKWASPWGVGYPGWHIECSVMARKLLKRDVIDIHTGGEDLIFPHHECEIAQSCGVTGSRRFANFWLHARFLFVNGEKMSKSKGTFYTARDVFEGRVTGNPVHPAVLRYELTKAHYRTNLDFSEKGLMDSGMAVRRLIEKRQSLEQLTNGQSAEVDLTHPLLAQFAAALADDLNIAEALAIVNQFARTDHRDPHEALGVWKKINSVLAIAPITEGLLDESDSGGGQDDAMRQAEEWCRELDAARRDKNYSRADELRKLIQDTGFEVRTGKEGTTIQRALM